MNLYFESIGSRSTRSNPLAALMGMTWKASAPDSTNPEAVRIKSTAVIRIAR